MQSNAMNVENVLVITPAVNFIKKYMVINPVVRIIEQMKNRSRKAKSTKLQNLVRAKILKAFPHLKKKDVDAAKE